MLRSRRPCTLRKGLIVFSIVAVALVAPILPVSDTRGLAAQSPATVAWPMGGRDAQRTGLSLYLGPALVPRGPSWVFESGAPIRGDIVVSAEGIIYFVSGDKLHALNPDGTAYVPAVSFSPIATPPVIDDLNGYKRAKIEGLNVG